jgi:hypothetical protein
VKHKIRTNSKFSCFFKKYFGLEILNQNKPWVPHVICGSCRATLEAWLRGEKRKMTCGIPRLWREPQNHVNDCFFCLLDLSHFKKTKNRFHIQYPDVPSFRAPVLHSVELPPPTNEFSSSEESASDYDLPCFLEKLVSGEENVTNPHEEHETNPHFLTQHAEILTSRLKKWNLLDKSCKITSSRKRHERFLQHFCLQKWT